MRILHVLDHSIPVHSGYTFRTIATLREQRARGWETFHLTSPKHGACDRDEEIVDGWHFFRTPMQSSKRALKALSEVRLMQVLEQRLEQIALRVRPTILHVHSPVLNALPSLRAGRRLRLPVVYEVRAFWEDAAVDHGTASEWGIRYRLTRALETYATRRADHVTTICEGLRGDLIGRGIPREKITVIPNGVDPAAFEPGRASDADLRARYGLDGCTVLGFIGSFYAYEGLSLVIDALPGLIRNRPNVKLLLVGGGPEEGALRSRVRDRGLQERVIFTGRIPNAEISNYYNLVDVLIYARLRMRLTELVTPLKPLEAMAQGRLFVASDVGGHRELITHRKTGFLFKAGDLPSLAESVELALTEASSSNGVRTAARQFVERERTWASSVARYDSVYADAIRRAGSGFIVQPAA